MTISLIADTVDVLTKKRVVNDGIVPQYYVENSHEPIVSKDVFIRVQEEMARRANLKAGKKRRVYSSKYALSSIVFCSKCGDIYRRVVWNNRGKHSVVWRCCNRVENGPKACDADSIPEVELHEAVIKAFNLVYKEKKSMIKTLQKNLKYVLESNTDPYKEIDRRLGDYISVTCEDGKIVIAQDAERAAVKAAEAEFMDREMKALQKRYEAEKVKIRAQMVAEQGARW